MINTRFSLLRAYFTGMKILLEYLSFYMIWYAVAFVAWFGICIGFGLYLDILDYNALTTNWSWINELAKQWFSEIKMNYSRIFEDFSMYGLLKLVLPVNILNHSIATMSWS